jgi:hypothetical protein
VWPDSLPSPSGRRVAEASHLPGRVRRRKFDAELNEEVECDTDDEEHKELDEMPELIKDWSVSERREGRGEVGIAREEGPCCLHTRRPLTSGRTASASGHGSRLSDSWRSRACWRSVSFT